jgi:general secretion pathway protein G
MNNLRSKRWRAAPGFTMIELIVVMTVIGLLLSLAVPRYFQALERGKRQVQAQNIALMREAIDKYYGDTGRYPDRLEDLVTRRYLRAVPIDPLTDKADWATTPPQDRNLGVIADVSSSVQTESLPGEGPAGVDSNPPPEPAASQP